VHWWIRGPHSLETGSSIVACMFISAGNCLPSRCLAMNYSGFQASCHNILLPSHPLDSPYEVLEFVTSLIRGQSLALTDRHKRAEISFLLVTGAETESETLCS
jgi:hypothetical protein